MCLMILFNYQIPSYVITNTKIRREKFRKSERMRKNRAKMYLRDRKSEEAIRRSKPTVVSKKMQNYYERKAKKVRVR